MKRSLLIGTVFLLAMALAPMVHAQSDEGSSMSGGGSAMSSSGSTMSGSGHSMKHGRMQACADKSAGDPCSYMRKGENMDGTCKSGRHAKLMCVASASGPTRGMTGNEANGNEGSGSMNAPSEKAPSAGSMGNEVAPSGGASAPPASTP